MEHQDFDHYQRLVDAALDGELDAARESQLYEQLAADAALRDTLRGAQAIRSATRAYSSAMTPPADLGAALFARLGVDTAATITTKKGHKNPIFGRAGLLPTVGLILLLSGSAFLYFLSSSNSSNPPASSTSTNTAPTNTAPVASAPAPSRAKKEGSHAETPRSESVGSRESAVTRPLSVPPPASPSRRSRSETTGSSDESSVSRDRHVQDRGAGSENDIRSESMSIGTTPAGGTGNAGTGAVGPHDGKTASLNPPDKGMATPVNVAPTHPSPANTASIPATPAPSLDALDIPAHQSLGQISAVYGFEGRGTDFIRDLRSMYPLRSGLSAHRLLLRLRGYGLSPSPSTDIGPRSSPLVNNMAASLMYNLGSEHALGLEGGQEAYPQEYEGTENGRTVRYQQNLLTPWIGVAYRYRPLWARSEAGVSGAIATHAGITREYWPQLRVAVGLQYAVIPPLSLELGIEGVLVAYPFQNRWFTTRKIGVTYGLLVSF